MLVLQLQVPVHVTSTRVCYSDCQPYTRVYVVSIHTIATHGTLVLQLQVPVHVT